MKIELLKKKGKKIIKEAIEQDNLKAVLDYFCFNGDVGMVIDECYCIVTFNNDEKTFMTNFCSQEEAEAIAISIG